MGRSRRTRDWNAETVSRDQILRGERGQGNIHFPCSADHEQNWQPSYPVDQYSGHMMCDYKYIYTYIHTYIHTYIYTYIHTYIRTYHRQLYNRFVVRISWYPTSWAYTNDTRYRSVSNQNCILRDCHEDTRKTRDTKVFQIRSEDNKGIKGLARGETLVSGIRLTQYKYYVHLS